jgi:hypothetical protein
MMEPDTYVVAISEGGWTVTLNGEPLASGLDRARAERAVMIAARMSRHRGRTAEIRLYNRGQAALSAAIFI